MPMPSSLRCWTSPTAGRSCCHPTVSCCLGQPGCHPVAQHVHASPLCPTLSQPALLLMLLRRFRPSTVYAFSITKSPDVGAAQWLKYEIAWVSE
jgi:hypothetical protein